MRQLTIDVNILVYGSAAGSPHYLECNSLMKCLESSDKCGIVMDSEDRIFRQYQKKLGGYPYGLKWLRTMLERRRVVHLKRANIPRSIRVELEEQGFVGEDYSNYVRTCVASCCKVLTSHDPDFSKASRLLRKRLEVRVEPVPKAEEFAREGKCRSCGEIPPEESPAPVLDKP